jgi:hypothetical protein
MRISPLLMLSPEVLELGRSSMVLLAGRRGHPSPRINVRIVFLAFWHHIGRAGSGSRNPGGTGPHRVVAEGTTIPPDRFGSHLAPEAPGG